MNSTENTDLSTPNRPMIVTILAIFTIIGTVAYFGFFLLGMAVPEIAMQEEWPRWIVAAVCICQLGKCVAAILLLKMRRLGFYLYAGIELIAAIMNILGFKSSMEFMDSSFVNPSLGFDPKVLVLGLLGMSIGLSIIYIGGFASHLNKMR